MTSATHAVVAQLVLRRFRRVTAVVAIESPVNDCVAKSWSVLLQWCICVPTHLYESTRGCMGHFMELRPAQQLASCKALATAARCFAQLPTRLLDLLQPITQSAQSTTFQDHTQLLPLLVLLQP